MPRRLSWIFRPGRTGIEQSLSSDPSPLRENIADALAAVGRHSPHPMGRFDGIAVQLTKIFSEIAPDFLAVTCDVGDSWLFSVISGRGSAGRFSAPGAMPGRPRAAHRFSSHKNQHCPLDAVGSDLPKDWIDWLTSGGAHHVCLFPEPIRESGLWFYAGRMYRSPEWTSLLNFTARLIVTTISGNTACAIVDDFSRDEILEREFGQWLRAHELQLLAEMLAEQLADQFGLDRSLFLFEESGEKRSITLHAHGIRQDKTNELAAGLTIGWHPEDPESPLLNLLSGKNDAQERAEHKMARAGFGYSLSVPAEDGSRIVGIAGGEGRRQLSRAERKRLEQWLQWFKLALDNQRRIAHLEALSYTDATTGLFNCRFFKRRLGEEITRARRFDRSLSLVIFDLDDFKLLNDTYGHLAGDQILREIGELLLITIRSIDIACRYGGDEFVVVMPETEKTDCICFTDRLQRTIVDQTFRPGRCGETERLTVSMGAAVFPTHADGPERLFWCADMAMLAAKEAGRNQVVLYQPGIHQPSRLTDR